MSQETPENPQRVEVIARLFGLSVRRIQQLTQEGILPTVQTSEGRRYDYEPTIQRYISYLSNKANGKTHSARELELKEHKMTAEIALKESQGELHRLKTAIEQGKYVPVEEVTLELQRFFVNFKKFAMNLPMKLTDELHGILDPLELRRLEKAGQGTIRRHLEAYVVAGVPVLPLPKARKGRNGKSAQIP